LLDERKNMTDKQTRISFDVYAMRICHTVALRATCRHRDQGAIIVRDKRIVAAGYNGAPPGVTDCLERGYCSKERDGECLAEGLHGESNAIISAGVKVDGTTLYCIYSPCRTCCNMVKTAGIKTLIFEQVYDGFPEGPEYLASMGVTVFMLESGRRVQI